MIVIYQKSWDANAAILCSKVSADKAYASLSATGNDVTIVYDWCANENVGVECDSDDEYSAIDALERDLLTTQGFDCVCGDIMCLYCESKGLMINTLHSALWEQRARGAMAAIIAQELIEHYGNIQHYLIVRVARSRAGLHYWQ